MTTLTPVVTDTRSGRLWIVRGENGVVSIELISTGDGVFGPIAIHYARPMYGEDHRPTECDILTNGRCYLDTAHRAGERLGRTWQTAGCDDKVIWAQLESWYRLRLENLADEDA